MVITATRMMITATIPPTTGPIGVDVVPGVDSNGVADVDSDVVPDVV